MAQVLDLVEAEAAYVRLEPELNQLTEDMLVEFRIDPQRAAGFAYSVAKRDQTPKREETLARLEASGVFEIRRLRELEDAALATFHARRKQLEAAARASDARVAEATVTEAQALRGKMLRVLDYHLGQEEPHATRLAAIRAGIGYQDLANDLLSLRDYYIEKPVEKRLRHDRAHYEAADAERATVLAGDLFKSLGLADTSEAAFWLGQTTRAYTLLSAAYRDLAAAGSLMFQRTENTSLTYPSLISAVRAPAKSVAPSAEGSDEEATKKSTASTTEKDKEEQKEREKETQK